jgi:hypothetical protein
MARNAPTGRGRAATAGPGPRRPPARPPAGRRPARRSTRDEPPEERDDDLLGDIHLPSEAKVALTRAELRRRRDRLVVFVMTPAVLLATALCVLVGGQVLYPDREAALRPAPTQVAEADEAPDEPTTPQELVVAEPRDPVKLSAGVVEKPPTFEWPEIDELRLVVEPSRPNEQADYTPLLSSTELRRQIEVMSVNLTLHTSPPLAEAAAGELAKSYPRRLSRQRVIGSNAKLGYIPDDTGIGLVFTVGDYRVQIETIAAAGPIRASQRAELEYHTLHLGDHIARRIQEVASSGGRGGLGATTTHWRDHLSRSLPFGR